jgi:hypothetical protein
LAAVVLFVSLAQPAHAQSTVAPDGMAGWPDLDAEALRCERWWWGWTLGYAALTLGQSAAWALVDERGTRADLAVGAATSLVGLGGMALSDLSPVAAARDAVRLRSPDVRNAVARAAEAEREGRRWWLHAANVALGIGAAAVLWLGYDRPVPGMVNGAIGIGVGEAQIWTQPDRLLDVP